MSDVFFVFHCFVTFGIAAIALCQEQSAYVSFQRHQSEKHITLFALVVLWILPSPTILAFSRRFDVVFS